MLNLPFKDTISRAERDNAIDVYIGDEYMDVLADGMWEKTFTEKPEVFTKEEKRAWLDQMTDVTPVSYTHLLKNYDSLKSAEIGTFQGTILTY